MSDFFLQTANEANALDDVQIIEQSKVVYQTHVQLQCIRKVAVHLGYGRVQLKCDGTW